MAFLLSKKSIFNLKNKCRLLHFYSVQFFTVDYLKKQIMHNKSTWLTIKYKEDSFDVKLSNESHVIQDIRSVDSEINIAAILDKKIIYAMQEMVDAEMNHKQYMQDKNITEEPIMQYKELRQINVSQHIEKKNGLSYLSWSWAVDQLLQLDDCASWEYLEPKQFGESMMVFL